MGDVTGMKMIFKIEEYLSETNQVIIRYCRKNSPRPITDYPAKAVSTEQYDTSFDSQNLVESIAQYGYKKVFTQEDKEITLPENTPVDIPNSLDIKDYVGKIICVEASDAQEMLRSRKMRRVDIE
tara:strand:- start:438 stop:812 length:375 start_codon:yes stop_codon:yes gene_type:complete